MRPNRWVLVVSLIVGLLGTWSYVTAIQDYRRTAEAFTSIELEYISGSFEWLDEEFGTAEARFNISNDSRADAAVEYLILRLYLDGEFAGAQYRPWQEVTVPAGEVVEITVPFEISISTTRDQAQGVSPTVRGEMRLAFDQVEQSLTVPLSESLSPEAVREN